MNKVAIQCKTKNEFKFLMQLYDKRGWKWYDGDSPTKNIDLWNQYKQNTCVEFSDRFTYSTINYFKKEGFKIFELDKILKRIMK